MVAHLLPSTRGGFGCLFVPLAALAALLLGCGATDDDDPIAANPPNQTDSGDSVTSGAIEVVNGAAATVDPGASLRECSTDFQACGGTLVGTWVVQGTCDSVTVDRRALDDWGQRFMELDGSACPEAVQSLSSRYSGRLLFRNGQAIDERLHSERAELLLSADCLSATLSLDVGEENLDAACSGFTSESTLCASVDGVCHCSVQTEDRPAATGTYGVLGIQVVIAAADTPSIIDYCVDADVLHWREPGTQQHLVLRREAAELAAPEREPEATPY